jgi:hypothetical protein
MEVVFDPPQAELACNRHDGLLAGLILNNLGNAGLSSP